MRGQVKYVVMSNSQYQYLRECELAAALAESKADIEAGRFIKETVAQHILRIKKLTCKPHELAANFTEQYTRKAAKFIKNHPDGEVSTPKLYIF